MQIPLLHDAQSLENLGDNVTAMCFPWRRWYWWRSLFIACFVFDFIISVVYVHGRGKRLVQVACVVPFTLQSLQYVCMQVNCVVRSGWMLTHNVLLAQSVFGASQNNNNLVLQIVGRIVLAWKQKMTCSLGWKYWQVRTMPIIFNSFRHKHLTTFDEHTCKQYSTSCNTKILASKFTQIDPTNYVCIFAHVLATQQWYLVLYNGLLSLASSLCVVNGIVCCSYYTQSIGAVVHYTK